MRENSCWLTLHARLVKTAISLLICGAPLAAGAATRVVAIGNNIGQAGDLPLRYAERDAEQLTSVLRRLGRVRADDALLLLHEDADTLRGVMERTNTRIRGAASDDTLIVYYSGHADATGLHLGDSTLPFAELESMVHASPARVRVLIVDACCSGGVTRVKGVRPAGQLKGVRPAGQLKGARPAGRFEIDVRARVETEGIAIITSSAGSEDSQESEELKASFFTHHLVNALRGAADDDRNRRVTLDEAYGYAYRQTLRSTGRTLNLQHPTYRYDLKGRGDLVVTHLTEDRQKNGVLAINEAGRYLLVEDRAAGALIAEVMVDAKGSELVLTPGRYLVERRGARTYRRYGVQLDAGARLALESQPYDEIAYARLLRKGGGDATFVHRVSVLAGARGELVSGAGVAPNLLVGYGLDLSWLSFGVQARHARYSTTSVDGSVVGANQETALRLRAERFVDLRGFSVALGLVVEGVHHRQSFQTTGSAPNRATWALGFGGILAVEIELSSRWLLRAEGGPLSQILRRADTPNGAITSTQIDTPLTWWGAVGTGWRF